MKSFCRKRWAWPAVSALALLVTVLPVWHVSASTIFGSVRGIVHDPQHRPIQSAQVTLKAQTSDWTQTVESNANGEFEFRSVPIGTYTVTVSSKGFLNTQQDVIVQSDTSPVLHFELAIAGAKENVVVSGTPAEPTMDTVTPTTLLNRQILVNDQLPSAIYYLGPNQANFQIPSNTPVGTARICVRTGDTGELIAGGALLTAAASPGLFTSTQNGSGQGAVVNQDGSLNSAANPAPVGSTITLYGTGQGQVSPAVSDGTPAPKLPLSSTVALPTSDGKTCLNSQPAVCVAIGSGFGNIQYTGLAPGYIGLWQINVTVPQGIVTGSAVPVKVVIDGIQSNLATIAVR